MEVQQKRFEKFFKKLKAQRKLEIAVAMYRTLSTKTVNQLDRMIIIQSSIDERKKASNKKN